MMRAVVFKDLRQQWPWLLGVFLLAIAHGAVNMVRWPATVHWLSMLLPFLPGNYYNIDPTPPLVRLEGIYMLASAYGAVLGLLQGLSDTRAASDFFLHRPCSPTRLALGKLFGGTLLFWAPGLLAIALMTMWAGFARFASPFRVWMALVPLLSWWIGYGFYLAAIQVAWRQGRWFGPRLLPVVAPILVAVLSLSLKSLPFVLLGLISLTIVYWVVNVHVLACRELGAVTWKRGWDSAARFLMGVTLLVGLLGVIAFVGALLVNLFPYDWDYRSVVFTKDGEPRIQKYEIDDTGTQVHVWLGLNGESVGNYVDYNDIPSLSMASMAGITGDNEFGNWARRNVTTLQRYSYGGDVRRRQAYWYLLVNDGVVVGYDHPTGAHLGSFGPQGRLEGGAGVGFASARQVQGTQWRTGTHIGYVFDHLFVDGDSLYSFTLNPPQMSKLYQSRAGQIDRVGLAYDWRQRGERGLLFTESNGRLSVLGVDGTEMGVADLPAALRYDKYDADAYMSAGWTGRRIVATKSLSVDRSLAYAFGPTGESLHEWDVILREPEPFVWWKSATHLPLNLCAAPGVGIAALYMGKHLYPYGPNLELGSYWPLLLLSALITFVSAILAGRHLRHRRSRANVICWLVVVALFSWPGYLLCLIIVCLPRRVGCPACSGRRPPETAKCPLCQGDWSPPKRTGLEILLPAHS